MRTGWIQACRGAIAFLGLVALCAPVALAAPPAEPPPVVAAEEVVAPAADAVVVSPDEVVAPGGDADVAPEPAADDIVVAPPADDLGEAPPADDSGAAPPADDPGGAPPADDAGEAPPAEDARGAPPAAPQRAAAAPLVSARTAQDQPPPAEPVPELPYTSDPSCVFPQLDPLDIGPCAVLASDCTVLGTLGPDILVGGATADLICGLGGDDQIDGGDGNDSILGGDGNDVITGGLGADCLLGQGGEDEFVDAPEADENAEVGVTDVAIEEGDEVPAPSGTDGFSVYVGRDGVCLEPRVVSEPQQPVQGGLQGVEAAGVVYELSRLINQASGETAAAFPLELSSTARAEDGVVRLLLDCDQTRVTGTLELFEQRGDRRVSAGEAEFDCTPPTEVVEVELEDAARERLEDRGRLAVIVRVAAEGYDEHEDRLTIRSAP